jgi:hypothetical protein
MSDSLRVAELLKAVVWLVAALSARVDDLEKRRDGVE